MRLYIAGQMRHKEDRNFPAFDACRDALRRQGHLPVSPADMDRLIHGIDGTQGDGSQDTKSKLMEYMDRDLAILKYCDGIVLLDGWFLSVGARLEKAYAEYFSIEIFLWDADNERRVKLAA